MYDYLLGGASNFAADREFANEVLAAVPEMRRIALSNRAFLRRAVRRLACGGLRQFLDLGSGMPTVGDTHEVAAYGDPGARVLYVDNDALAVAHAELIHRSTERVRALRADIREPDRILAAPETAEVLDLNRPVVVLMVAVLHFVPDSSDPAGIVARYRDAVAPGSYLVFSHATADGGGAIDAAGSLYRDAGNPMILRSAQRCRELLAGWELLDPGLVYAPQWHPDWPEDPGEHPERSCLHTAVARKPWP